MSAFISEYALNLLRGAKYLAQALQNVCSLIYFGLKCETVVSIDGIYSNNKRGLALLRSIKNAAP